MATEDGDATPPSLCDFCHHDAVVWQTEQLRFSQRTNRGTARCEVSLPIGRCDTCGSVHLEDGAETLIEAGVLHAYIKLLSGEAWHAADRGRATGRGRTGIQGRGQEKGQSSQAMKCAAPPCCTLTAARLDRDANLDRDHAAVATALYHDAGLPADQAITTARETFRPGETVRDWWNRATTDTERTSDGHLPTPLMGHEPYERKGNASTRRTRAPAIRKS